MKYYQHFGMRLDPFEKNSIKDHHSFESLDFKIATEQLVSATERNGFALITALPGLGKSHAIDRFLESLDTAKLFTPSTERTGPSAP